MRGGGERSDAHFVDGETHHGGCAADPQALSWFSEGLLRAMQGALGDG